MQYLKKLSLILIVLVISTSCTTTHVTRSSPVELELNIDYSNLRAVDDDRFQNIYILQDIDLQKYDKIMIPPITVNIEDDSSDFHSLENQKKIELLKNISNIFKEQLSKKFQLTDKKGKGVIILDWEVTSAEKSDPLMDLYSNIVPAAIVLSTIKRMILGTHLSVGSAAVKIKLSDSLSNETLIVLAGHRSGNKTLTGKFDSWDDAQGAFDQWAVDLTNKIFEIKLTSSLRAKAP
jgi:hypothetical protein